MKRLEGLQADCSRAGSSCLRDTGLLDEDVFSILGEIEGAARLARRRTALRRHLDSVDRLEISAA